MCIGFVDKDNIGIAGMEKYLDSRASPIRMSPGFNVDPDALKPVRLSLDLEGDPRACATNSSPGLEKFKAKAAAGAIMDVNTGEIIALESLPDYDPNDPGDMTSATKRRSTASTSASTRWARPSRR